MTGPGGAADRRLVPVLVTVAVLLGAGAGALLMRPGAGPAAQATVPLTTFGAPSQPTNAVPTNLSATPRAPAASGNQVLPGSPEIVLLQRDGDDLRLLGWRAGEPDLEAREVIAGAFQGIATTREYAAQLAPDGRRLLLTIAPTSPDDSPTFRAYQLDAGIGHVIWESGSLGRATSAGFLGSDHVIVTVASMVQMSLDWTVIDLSADAPVEHHLQVPPVPRASAVTPSNVGDIVFNYSPFAMSADARWIYATAAYGVEPLFRPALRVEVKSGDVVPIDTFPLTGDLRTDSTALDATGRLLLAGPHATAGSGFVEAWQPGAATPDFKIDLGSVFGARWLGDGRAITAAYDKVPGPFHFRILTLTPTGALDATLFEADGSRNASLIDATGGFAAAYIVRTAGMRSLMVIRTSDGAISTIDVPDPDGMTFNLALRP